jgi:dTDP-4-dehydrorhamnose 3,5-epimerase
MKITPLDLAGAFCIEPEPISDHRGSFARVFCQRDLHPVLGGRHIVQINHSTTRGVGMLRGMHFQYPPCAEDKLVRCVCGAMFDVMVDLRRGSPTFLRWYGETLRADNMKMLFIPAGFAHGFQALTNECETTYCVTEYYRPEYEGIVRADDPRISIGWPLEISGRSSKDAAAPLLTDDFSGIEIFRS